nr:zinc finger, CCHC-type [Tanacetum cinerariifolium]
MADVAIKHMASSFAKLKKFEGVNFKRWQKKMHFMLFSMSVVYVLTTPMPEDGGENPTVEQVRKRAKWDNDDYVCRGLILNGMSDSLFDIYQNVDTSKELWDTLEAKYMADDASSKKFLVSNFTNYKMTDSRPVLEQYNELLGILERYNDHKGKRKHHDTGANPKKKPKVTCWKCEKPGHLKKDCKAGNVDNKANGSSTKGSEDGSFNPLKGQNKCWFKTYELLNDGSILHMENKSKALVHGRGCVDLRLNIVSDNIGPAFMSTSKLNDSILWIARLGHAHFKTMKDMSTDSDLYDLHATPSLGNKKYFVTFIDDASRFYVIEPNDSVAINFIIESRDAIFDEHMFSYVPRRSQRSLVKGTEDSGGTKDEISDQHSYCFNVEDDPKTFDEAMNSQGVAYWKEAINEEMDSIMGNNTWVLTDLPPGCRPFRCKWIFKRKLKVDETVKKFKARLVIQGFNQKSGIDYFDTMTSIHNLIIHQMDVKTAFLNVDLEEEVYMNQPLSFIINGNENKMCKLIKSLYRLKQTPKQWHHKFDEVVLSNGYLLNQADKCVYSKFDASGKGVIICLYVDDMLIFDTDKVQSHYIEKVLKKFNYSDCTPVSTPMYTCKKLMPNKGLAVSQLEYSRVIGCLMYAMNCTRLDIAFAVGKLSRLVYSGYHLVLKGYTDASWISNTEDNSSISGWVFLFGGGAISWASKKQTFITGSTMKSEFVALAAADKKAKWLKNLLFEIPLWVKPMAPISIRCDSTATLAKAYSQMYNGKSRHLGIRRSMIRELIMNQKAEAHVLQIILRMCLEPAGSVHTDIWGWRYGVYIQRSMNIRVSIVVKGIHVSEVAEGIPSEEVSSVEYLYSSLFQIEPSAENMELFSVKMCWGNFAFDYVYSNSVGANVFNSFITNAGLEEVPLGGSSFTWCHKYTTKMSKLDTFLISENLLSICPNITAITLERYLSDHRPILLRESHFDYGSTPFRFFHYWIEMEGFSKVVEDAWKEGPCDESNAMINMMMKLKYLKAKIREWNKNNMLSAKNVKAKHKEELEALEAIIDKGDGNVEVVNKRMEVVNTLQKIDKLHSSEMAQKAKVKWSIEGDENSSFFHGMLNKKRSLLNIRGIMVDGIWIKSPNRVKRNFFHHFGSRFDKPDAGRAHIEMRYPKTLTFDQHVELESDVSNEEIKRAVWNCGTDKSPSPDGFTFGFYRRLWRLIEIDVYDAVKYFFTYGVIPKGCNTSFIALILKILDANMPSLDSSFRRVPRGGVEQEQFDDLSALVHDVTLAPMSDRWNWALESSGEFSVALVRKVIDAKLLPEDDSKTRWIKYVSIKVNAHA